MDGDNRRGRHDEAGRSGEAAPKRRRGLAFYQFDTIADTSPDIGTRYRP
jgi:hypothetical protein